ncbi:MAG: leucine-rich repeat protein [Bacilli bacterium]|nr:leucine-rich repeat protein [Bacilli bacterium]MBR1582002.1 leucine-rich repeat protein [Bacilli bacterium]
MKNKFLLGLAICLGTVSLLSGCTKDDLMAALDNNTSELQSEIDNLKEQIKVLQDKITSLDNSMSEEIKNVKNDYQAKIDECNLKINQNTKKIKELEEQLALEKANLEKDYNDKLAGLKLQFETKNEELSAKILKNSQDLEALTKKHDDDKKELQDDYNKKINDLDTKDTLAREELQKDYKERLENLDNKYFSEVEKLNETITSLNNSFVNFKIQYDADKKALEEDYNTKINSLSENEQAARDKLKEEFQEALEQLETEFNNQVSTINSNYEELKAKHDADKIALEDDYNSKINSLSEEELKARNELKEDYDKKISDLDNEFNEKVNSLNESLESLTTNFDLFKEQYVKDKKALEDALNEEILNLNNKLDSTKNEIIEDYNKKIGDLDQKYQEQVTVLNQALEQDKSDLNKFKENYAVDKKALEEEFESKLNNLVTKYDAEISDIQGEINSLNSELVNLKTEMNNLIEEIQNDYNSKISDIISRLETLEAVEYHTVTFNSNGGNEVASQKVKHGEKVKEPTISRTGYNFNYWTYKEKEFDFDYFIVTEDITLEASWSYIPYSVTFKNDDGSILEKHENIEYGTSIEYEGETPTKAIQEEHYVYEFTGWDIDTSFVNGDLIATAQYSASYAPYTVEYLDEDGTLLQSKYVTSENESTYDGEVPTKENDELYEYQFKERKKISADDQKITFKAEYYKKSIDITFEQGSYMGENLEWVYAESCKYVSKYSGIEEEPIIPDMWDNQKVVGISQMAFQSCSTVKKISLPRYMRVLNELAFYHCNNLSEITFNDDLILIGDSCFSSTKLKTIKLNKNLLRIDPYAFSYCDLIDEVEIPEKITSDNLGPKIFYACKNLSKVTIHENIKEIPSEMFHGCTSLKEVQGFEYIETFNDSCFYACSLLNDGVINISKNVKSIGKSVFSTNKIYINASANLKLFPYIATASVIYLDIENDLKTFASDWSSGIIVLYGYKGCIYDSLGSKYAVYMRNGEYKARLETIIGGENVVIPNQIEYSGSLIDVESYSYDLFYNHLDIKSICFNDNITEML